MPSLASIFTLFVYLPLEALTEGFPALTELCRHRGHDDQSAELVHLCRTKRDWIAGLAQPAHNAQLGDPCTEPGDCKVPNSECIPTDNLYWNRQSFCVCQPGFHPSTGFCVADSGSESQTGMVKLDYNNQKQSSSASSSSSSQQPQQPMAVTESSNSGSDDTGGGDSGGGGGGGGAGMKNTSSRSLLVTPSAPQQNLLQGFHFGNRTQAVVSNIVEQLTHLRGQQQTDQMKQRLETLGLPLLQPHSSLNREDGDEPATATISSLDSNSYSSEPPVVQATLSSPPGSAATPTTTSTSTTSSTTQLPTTPSVPAIPSTPPPFGSLFPVPDKQMIAPRASTTPAPIANSSGATPTPTMGTFATLKSSHLDNPFLPVALPPFLTKPNTAKTSASSTTTTTMMAFNITTTTMATSPSADDPESKLALLKKVQNLIAGTSPVTQQLAPDSSFDQTTPPFKMLASVNPPIAVGSPVPKGTPPLPRTTPSPVVTSPAADIPAPQPGPALQPGPPLSVPRAGMPKPHQMHHQPTPAGVKQILNNFSLPKAPPIPLQPPIPGQGGNPPAPVPGPAGPVLPATATQSSGQQPDGEPQNQVRSTLVDHLPNVDFYAVFRSAAENVIREYLGSILTTTVSPFSFPQLGQPHGNNKEFDANAGGASNTGSTATGGGNVEKIIEKFMESKTGAAAVLAATGGSGNPPSLGGQGLGGGLNPGQFIAAMSNRPGPPPGGKKTPAPILTTPPPSPTLTTTKFIVPTPTTTPVTRPRHPLIWRSTSPGQASARPLPRIVFTGR